MTLTSDVLADPRMVSIRDRFAGVGVAQMADAAPEYVRPLRLPLQPRNGRPRVCGPVFPVTTNDDMLPCLQALAATPAGWVLLIHNLTVPSEAIVGDIFAASAQVQGLAGIVVSGAVRDLQDLRDIDVPVFSTEVTFVSARTTHRRAEQVPVPVDLGGVAVKPGDWLFGDADGFLVVEAERAAAVVTAGAVLRKREDGLKAAIRQDRRSVADLTNLSGYLEGSSQLGYVP
jgi:4-hydroxy-4-methyl-2-oxoglutarate aldolase